ncbi:MAG: hypothetical protein ACK56F_09285, partial [bacterium]
LFSDVFLFCSCLQVILNGSFSWMQLWVLNRWKSLLSCLISPEKLYMGRPCASLLHTCLLSQLLRLHFNAFRSTSIPKYFYQCFFFIFRV